MVLLRYTDREKPLMFLPADFDTAESLWEQSPVDRVEQEMLDWEPSEEDREWAFQQEWAAMTA